jgi:hypothetical protein
MKKIFTVVVALGVGVALGRMFDGAPPRAEAGGGRSGGVEECTARNGDVNADGRVDLSDAVTVLGHLFLGNPTELVGLCAPPPAASGLPDTGQRTCYDSGGRVIACTSATCFGQDGFYQTGCPPEGRFVDNGDRTVTDTCTGVMWQKETAPGTYDWCTALAYCEGLELAGHDDWRLPNVRELQSIVDYERWLPSIDPVFGTVSSWYWSSTSCAVDTDFAWRVLFNLGFVDNNLKGGVFHVRAVRRGP